MLDYTVIQNDFQDSVNSSESENILVAQLEITSGTTEQEPATVQEGKAIAPIEGEMAHPSDEQSAFTSEALPEKVDVGEVVDPPVPEPDLTVPPVAGQEMQVSDDSPPFGGAEAGQKEPATLELFGSSRPCSGVKTNTSFATTPTAITDANASEFLRNDYTTIRFTNGYRCKDNFEYALSIPGDTDNSHSDNPEDWLTIEGESE